VLAALLSVTAVLFTVSEAPLAWGALRFVTGICFAGIYSVIESWVSGVAGSAHRGRLLAAYMICNKTALMFGQGLLALGDAKSAAFFLVVCVCFSLSLVPVALTRTGDPFESGQETLGIRTLYRIAPIGIVGCVGAGLNNSAVLGLTPVYGLHVGFAPNVVPMLIVAAQVGSLAAQWPLGWLSDRIDRRRVIIAITMIGAAASLGAGLVGGASLPVVLALFAIWGACSLSVYPICVAHASDFAEPAQLVPLIGSLLFGWAIGSVVGPPIATFAMTRFGPAGLPFYAAAIAVLVGLFAAWRMSRRPPVPVDEREAFVNLPATSPAIAELSVGAGSQDRRRAPGEAGAPAPASGRASSAAD